MAVMDATPDPTSGLSTPPPAPRSGLDSFFDSIRRIGIARTESRWIGGVSGGLARRLGIDVALTRGILLVLAIFGGLGLVLYGAAWALLPEERDGRIHLQETLRGNVDGAIVGAIALIVLGIARPGATWSASIVPWGRAGTGVNALLAALLMAGVIVLVVSAIASDKKSGARVGPVSLLRNGGPIAPAAGLGEEGTAMNSETAPQPGATGTEPGATAGDAGTPPAAYPRTYAGAQQGPYAGGYPPPGQPYGPPHGAGPTYAAAPTPYHAGPVAYGQVPPTAYPQVPPPPTAPRKAQVRGPGASTLGVIVALTMIAAAGLLIADRAGRLSASPWAVAAGAFVVLLGLGIVAAGFRGRSSGVLGFLGIVAILFASPVAAWNSNDWSAVSGPHVGTGTQRYAPIDRATAADGFSLGVGESRIDLSSVPMTREELAVPIRIGVGDLTVVVPHGASVRANVRVQAGEIDWNVDPEHRMISGTGLKETLTSSNAAGGSPNLVLNIRAGAAQVTIEEN